MALTIAAVASFISFLSYLTDTKRFESIGFDRLRFSKPAQRQGPAPPVSAPDFRISSFEFRFSIFELPNSAMGQKKTNELFAPTSTYLQHNKSLTAEYFVRQKITHLAENA
jgi:hypothetical protein